MASALFHSGAGASPTFNTSNLTSLFFSIVAISHFACWSLCQLQIWPAASWRSWLEIHGDSFFFVSEMIIGIRVYAKFKVDFTSKTILLRRRGLAMGSSYAVLLLFFSFEGAQSCYHVAAVWNQEHTKHVNAANITGTSKASRNLQFCGVRGTLAANQVHPFNSQTWPGMGSCRILVGWRHSHRRDAEICICTG